MTSSLATEEKTVEQSDILMKSELSLLNSPGCYLPFWSPSSLAQIPDKSIQREGHPYLQKFFLGFYIGYNAYNGHNLWTLARTWSKKSRFII